MTDLRRLATADPSRLRILAGLIGLVGALALFSGDQLIWHAGQDPRWITVGGLLAVPGGVCLLPGVWHIRERLRPVAPWLTILTILLFVALFVLAAATHAVWGAYALVEQDLKGPADESHLFVLYLGGLGLMGRLLGIPASLILLVLTLTGRMAWPRWMAMANPGLLYFALGAAPTPPGPIGAAIAASTFNFAFVVFFLAATLAPWRQTP